jgi:hypothetical protein
MIFTPPLLPAGRPARSENRRYVAPGCLMLSRKPVPRWNRLFAALGRLDVLVIVPHRLLDDRYATQAVAAGQRLQNCPEGMDVVLAGVALDLEHEALPDPGVG